MNLEEALTVANNVRHSNLPICKALQFTAKEAVRLDKFKRLNAQQYLYLFHEAKENGLDFWELLDDYEV